MTVDPDILRAGRRALTAGGRFWGLFFVFVWLGFCALALAWEPDSIAFAAIMFGVVFALPGLYILLRTYQESRSLLNHAELVRATLTSWKVHKRRPNRARYPLALTKYVVELHLDGGPEWGEITAAAYRGVRRSVDELYEGLDMELLIEEGERERTVVVRWPNGKWVSPGGLRAKAASLSERRASR